MVCINQNKKGNAYLIDLDSHTVIREYFVNSKFVKDLTVLNEKETIKQSYNFLCLGGSSISLFDIR